MCGICGLVSRSQGDVDLSRLLQMRDTMIHRGPDGAGYYLDAGKQVGFGHRRLKIIDLTDAAAQPMTNEDRSIWLTFNGEIYNYLELVPILERCGHTFASHSDTEVIIHAYEEWGADCLSRFNGMFAFALWDEKKRRLFFARDRVGIKPFYYSFSGTEFLFASELKAIAAAAPENRSPSYESIYDFLTLMRFDHSDRTFLANVKQLRGGQYLLLELDDWRPSGPARYWTLSPTVSAQTLDYSRPADTFRELLFDSIRLQLRSDVPVGTFLSGGLDSSSLVAIISRLVPQPMKSFSVAYNEAGYNEQDYMDAVIESYPVIPTRTFPDVQKFVTDLTRFVWAQDSPPAGPGPFSEWCVAESAKGSVTVLLNGQGPDEMLGGYPVCFPTYMHELRHLVQSRQERRGWRGLFEDARILSLLYEGGFRTSSAYYLVSSIVPDQPLQAFLERGKRAIRERWLHPDLTRVGRSVESLSRLSDATAFDGQLHSWLLDTPLPALLHYADRNSMAFSLEARVPYLDHRLVEYAAGLPLRAKLSPPFTKQVLREAMDGLLIPKIRERQTKLGFSTPVSQWLRHRPELLTEILSERCLKQRGIVRPERVKEMIRLHIEGGKDYGWDLWRLLVLEIWYEVMIDATRPIV